MYIPDTMDEQYINTTVLQYLVPHFSSGKFQYAIWAGGSLMSVSVLTFTKLSYIRYQYNNYYMDSA